MAMVTASTVMASWVWVQGGVSVGSLGITPHTYGHGTVWLQGHDVSTSTLKCHF